MNMICPFCKKSKIVKQGYRKNKSGKKQKYQCLNCEKWFIEHDGFERMRHDPKIIMKSIHQHIDGLSLFQVRNHFNQYDNVKVSRKTIADWTKKYSVFLK